MMMQNWLKWLACCLLITLPYNLTFFSALNKFSLIWQIIAYIFSSLLIFSLFVTIFFCLDKWLIKRGYTKFRTCLIKVFGLKILGFILLFVSPSFIVLYYMVFADMFILGEFDKILRMKFVKIFHHNYDFYELLKELVVVPIFLLGEMVFLLVTMAIVWQFDNIYLRMKNIKNA